MLFYGKTSVIGRFIKKFVFEISTQPCSLLMHKAREPAGGQRFFIWLGEAPLEESHLHLHIMCAFKWSQMSPMIPDGPMWSQIATKCLQWS